MVGRGVPFREAYAVAAGLVHGGKPLEELTLEEYKAAHPAFDEGVYAAVDLDACVKRRHLPIAEELAAIEAFLKTTK